MSVVKRWLALLPLLFCPALAMPAEDLLDKYSFCLVCHGYQGQGNTTVLAPALAGIEPWYLAAALDAYRSGQRHTSASAMEMQTAARMIAPAELDEATMFIASLQPADQSLAAVAADDVSLQRGAAAWAQYCAACHGITAEGNAQLAAPGLRRLNDWYLTSSWQAYLSGGRGDDAASVPARQMSQFARSLPADAAADAAMADLIAYILTL